MTGVSSRFGLLLLASPFRIFLLLIFAFVFRFGLLRLGLLRLGLLRLGLLRLTRFSRRLALLL